jgi:hypothetical protein
MGSTGMKRFTLIICFIFLLMIMVVPVTATTTTIANDSITTVSPAVGQTGKTVTVTITGNNFTTTAGSVRLEKSGESDIEAQSISSWSQGSQIICKIKISSTREPGKWDIVVVKGYDNTEIVKANAFTITDAMTLTSITPASGQAGDDDVDFTLVGTNFENDDNEVEEVFLFNKDYDTNITADFDIESSTKIKGSFDLEDADDDTYDVCVEDSFGAVECDLSFKIITNDVGSIEISSSPSGASIFVDGIANGTTPKTVDDLPVGSHKIILRKTGYEEWGKSVTVGTDETAEVDAKLYAAATATPVQTTNPATIQTTRPTTARTTAKSTIKIPTSWVDTPTTAASPVDPVIVLGAAGIGIGLVVLRRR